MNSSSLDGGFLSGPSGGLLDLESPISRHRQVQLDHPSVNHHHHHVGSYSGLGTDHQSFGLMEPNSLAQKGMSMNYGKGKDICEVHGCNTSEEDEPFAEDGNGENYDGQKGKKASPWQRMKWTDNVVRLLIAVVACVGDDGTLDGAEGLKRKYGTLQKKGKWKTVSKIMISKGCCVSPQQCEDKFNDLNKRYKRLNEILGRGTSCRVVENPALMDSMPNLSAKMKDVVRKILSSKHLFYQEMCAYHNGQRIPNCQDLDLQIGSLLLSTCSKDHNGSGEEAGDDVDSDENEEDEDQNHNSRSTEKMMEYGREKRTSEEDDSFWPHSAGLESFEMEMTAFLQDPTRSHWEKKDWVKNQMLQLLEQKVSHQEEAFELQKRHFKWQRFCLKKDRELEKSRLENERKKLENERMELLLKQKERDLELKRSQTPVEPSISIDRYRGRDQIDLTRLN